MKGLDILLPVILLGVGAVVAQFLTGSLGYNSGELSEKTQSLMYVASIFFLWFAYSKLGSKYQKLKIWVMNTLQGITLMAFSIGFLVTGIVNVYMATPFPQWLHLFFAVVLALVAVLLAFVMAAKTDS